MFKPVLKQRSGAHMNNETGWACGDYFSILAHHDGGLNPQSSFCVKMFSKVYINSI